MRVRYSLSAVASKRRLTKKCGTVVQLWVVRSAMMRPRDDGTSMLRDFLSGGAAGAVAEACTSEARISPPGPEPCTFTISTPSSLARRRALGEIFALDVEVGDETGAATVAAGVVSVFACKPALAAGALAALSTGTCSPGATIHAIVCPTGMSAPSCALIPARMPSAG